MASYIIHKETDINPIKVVTPTNTEITATDDGTTVTVIIPKGTIMGLGTAVGESSNYFNFNYCAYIAVVFKDEDGTETVIPSSDTISKLQKVSSVNGDGEVYYADEWVPNPASFNEFSNNVIVCHRGSVSTKQSDWSHSISNIEDLKIEITIPTGALSYDVYVSGCSINTAAYFKYIYQASSPPSWGDTSGGGGNSCGHAHTPTNADCSELLWTNLTGGSLILSDNKNDLLITGTNFKKGTSNKIESSTLQITFEDSLGASLNTTTPYEVSVGKTSEGNINKNISIATVVASSNLAKVTQVTVKLVGVGQREDSIETAAYKLDIKYYTCPAAPSSLWYISNNKSSLNGTFKPSYKKDITWEWSGAAAGTNTPVKGYRVFFVNETKSVYIDTDIDNITATKKIKTESGTGKNPCYETTGTSMSFNPQTVGFDKNETCTCYVYTYSFWGDGTTKLFSNNDKAPRYPGSRAVKSAQCTFGGSTVWVRVPKSDNPDVLEWKEGTVYVYHDGGWKEAEGVYVRNGGEWKEST